MLGKMSIPDAGATDGRDGLSTFRSRKSPRKSPRSPEVIVKFLFVEEWVETRPRTREVRERPAMRAVGSFICYKDSCGTGVSLPRAAGSMWYYKVRALFPARHLRGATRTVHELHLSPYAQHGEQDVGIPPCCINEPRNRVGSWGWAGRRISGNRAEVGEEDKRANHREEWWSLQTGFSPASGN